MKPLNSDVRTVVELWLFFLFPKELHIFMGRFSICYVVGRSNEKGGYHVKHKTLTLKKNGPTGRLGVLGVNVPEFVQFKLKPVDINVDASTLLS